MHSKIQRSKWFQVFCSYGGKRFLSSKATYISSGSFRDGTVSILSHEPTSGCLDSHFRESCRPLTKQGKSWPSTVSCPVMKKIASVSLQLTTLSPIDPLRIQIPFPTKAPSYVSCWAQFLEQNTWSSCVSGVTFSNIRECSTEFCRR